MFEKIVDFVDFACGGWDMSGPPPDGYDTLRQFAEEGDVLRRLLALAEEPIPASIAAAILDGDFDAAIEGVIEAITVERALDEHLFWVNHPEYVSVVRPGVAQYRGEEYEVDIQDVLDVLQKGGKE